MNFLAYQEYIELTWDDHQDVLNQGVNIDWVKAEINIYLKGQNFWCWLKCEVNIYILLVYSECIQQKSLKICSITLEIPRDTFFPASTTKKK